MKRQICLFLLFLGVLSLSCSRRWCNTHFPGIVDSFYSYRDTTIYLYRDTTIKVYLPGKTIIDSVFVPYLETKDSVFNVPSVYLKTDFAEAYAWMDHSYIKLRMILSDTTIQIRLDSAIRQSEYYHSELTRIMETREKKFIPGFYKFGTFAFIGIMALLILIFIIRLLK
jgi:hypothetical protein